ncbi:MAG: hypothetical protein Tsb0013_11670 [Phycisphaerales bacterium]
MPIRTCTLLIVALLGACSSTSSTAPDAPSRSAQLEISAFSDPEATVARPSPPDADETRVTASPPLTTRVGAPQTAPGTPAGEAVVVDRVVGQINGQPIFAEEFYRDSARRWLEESRTIPVRQWTQNLRTYTEETLYLRLREELLLAEFRASLSEPQRAGVLAFVQGLRDEQIRLRGGSEQEANRRFLEEQGVTLDHAIQNQAEREFIYQQLRNTIARRVQVSSRDIELYYNRNLDEYQPAPTATLRQAFAPKDNPERIAEIDALFASPEPLPEGFGTVTRVELSPGGVAETTFFGPAPLNEAARTLSAGASVGPIELGSNLWWLRMESIESPPHRSLYEAQLEIEDTIRAQRLAEEEAKYFERLLARSNVSEINLMVAGLLDYAIERFYRSGEDDEG